MKRKTKFFKKDNEKRVKLYTHNCGYKWVSRVKEPKQCPYCKSYLKERQYSVEQLHQQPETKIGAATRTGFELYGLAQGKILIAHSDKNMSVGTLEINPNQELSKHNRPCLESLFQLKGACVMKLFQDDGSIKEVTLHEGNSLDIPAKTFHVHSNPFGEKSLTVWKASGDITEIINEIRKNSKM